jgi:hypothetical protein
MITVLARQRLRTETRCDLQYSGFPFGDFGNTRRPWIFSFGMSDALVFHPAERTVSPARLKHSSVAQWQSIRLLTEGL